MIIPVEKNKEYIVDIIDNSYEGNGVAKIDDYIIFIPGAIKGEKVKILIVKVNNSYGYGKILQIIETSNSRVEADCLTFKRCGGCDLRHMNYASTLQLKKDIVQNAINRMIEDRINVNDTIGMEHPYHYRNKAVFPVGYNKNNELLTGVYANRTHEIIESKECLIQNEQAEKIAKFIIEFMKSNNIEGYNEQTLKRNHKTHNNKDWNKNK